MALTADQYTDALAALTGDDGAAVRLVQSLALGFRGYHVDGVPGPATRDALAALRPPDAPRPSLPPRGHALASATEYRLSEHGPDHPIGEHFVLVEMASRDGADRVLVHDALVDLLNRLREHFDKPVTINSGYRSPSHNKRIGGASQSRHVFGLAADVTVSGVAPDKVADWIESQNPGGLGRYKNFTHVDTQGFGRRWDFR